MLTAIDANDLFDALVVVHVICAVVGFGSLLLSGVYGFSVRRPSGRESMDEARRYFASPGRLELLVVVVPFLGLAALLVQPHGRGADQLWALLAAVVWAVAVGVLFTVTRPAERRLRAALESDTPPGQDPATVGAQAARVGWSSVVTDVAFFVALLLMVFQPR